jgi:hypothetical protein
MASAAHHKMAGVPVELRLATILVAILALFPMPVTITRPWDSMIWLTDRAKSGVSLAPSPATAFRLLGYGAGSNFQDFFRCLHQVFLLIEKAIQIFLNCVKSINNRDISSSRGVSRPGLGKIDKKAAPCL